MEKIYRLLILLTSATLAMPAHAAFEMKQTSARAAAMGNAFLASSGDPAALFSNPAGIASISAPEVAFLYNKPFAGLPNVNLNAGHAAFVLPTAHGHIGLGYALFDANSLLREQTLALSYGIHLHGIQLGLTAKQLSHAYNTGSDPLAASDPVFAKGTSKSALAFDVGAIAPLGKMLKAGIAVRNLNQPDLGLVTEDRISREVQTGLMLNMAGLGLKATGDIFFRSASAGEVKQAPTPYLGLEKTFKSPLALRLGANQNEFTGGFGLTLNNLSFDYALVINKNLVQDNAGSHKIGMKYRFSSLGRK
jgi:hypothetical protein